MVSVKKEKLRLIVTFLLPALFLYCAFFIYPAVRAFYVSLHDWSGFTPEMKYVGLSNFIELFHDEVFWLALSNNLLILFVGGALIFGIALLFSFFMSNRRLKGKNFFRTLFFFPNVVPLSALAVLFALVFNYKFGLLNNFLRSVGLENFARDWFGSRSLAMGSIIGMLVLIYMGFYLVLLLAGIEKIPSELYEAAITEGASEFTIFTKITIPLIWDVMIVAISLWIISALKFFELIWALTKGGPGNSTHTIATYLYTLAFGERFTIFRMGYATSIGVVLLLLVVIFVGILRSFFSRESIEY